MSDFLLGIKTRKAVKNCQKHGENNEFFRANHSFFESESAVHFQKKRKEQRVQFTHGRSFLKRTTRVNRSQSLYKESDFERKSEKQKSEFPTLGFKQQLSQRFLCCQGFSFLQKFHTASLKVSPLLFSASLFKGTMSHIATYAHYISTVQ